MAIYLQVWAGMYPSAKLIDMTHAGKHGKTCRVMSVGVNSPGMVFEAMYLKVELPMMFGDAALAKKVTEGGTPHPPRELR